jgi:hypothetical protein
MYPQDVLSSCFINHIVAYLFKERTVEPEGWPLLANGSETTLFLGNGREMNNVTTSIARQQILNKQEHMADARERLGKHVPAAMDTQATASEDTVGWKRLSMCWKSVMSL